MKRFSNRQILIFILLLLGAILLFVFLRQQTNLLQRASSDPLAEAESGVTTGNVSVKDDSSASGGKFIEFGSTQITPGPWPTSRPIFGTYLPSDKFARFPTLQDLVFTYAKAVYPDAMNYCGPGDWSNPQVILSNTYTLHPNFVAKMDSVLRNSTVLQKGIIGRGYVMNTKEGGWPRPNTLPQDVSNPQFGEAMRKVEVDCTKSIIGLYKDRIKNWRIANEMFEDNGQRRISWHTNQPVDIKHKLTAAMQEDPQAKLYIDDYSNTEINVKSTGMLNYMKELKQQGYPIHGIGFQGHFSLRFPPNYQSIRDNIQRFKDAGFEVAFTEVDVAIDGASGTTDEKRQRQKDIFKNTAQICKEFSNCTYYMLFGLDDNENWLGADAFATPFDTNFQAKPAWTGLKEVFGF